MCELLIALIHQPLACRFWVTCLEKAAAVLLYWKVTTVNGVFPA